MQLGRKISNRITYNESQPGVDINTGFNRKSYCLFLEDCSISLEDIDKLYKDHAFYKQTKNRGKLAKVMLRRIYGCVYKQKTWFRFTNRTIFYNCKIKLHIIRFKNKKLSMRDIMLETFPTALDFEKNNKISTKIEKEKAYSKDIGMYPDNKITTNIETKRNCRLNDSTFFQENIKILEKKNTC